MVIGVCSVHYFKEIPKCEKSCYFPANAQQVLLSQPMLGSVCKDILPTHCIISVIYNYIYQCETDYIARTNQSLETRIDKHIAAKIHHGKCDNLHKLVNTSSSANFEHLSESPQARQ